MAYKNGLVIPESGDVVSQWFLSNVRIVRNLKQEQKQRTNNKEQEIYPTKLSFGGQGTKNLLKTKFYVVFSGSYKRILYFFTICLLVITINYLYLKKL